MQGMETANLRRRGSTRQISKSYKHHEFRIRWYKRQFLFDVISEWKKYKSIEVLATEIYLALELET